jgi:hypothetical protein
MAKCTSLIFPVTTRHSYLGGPGYRSASIHENSLIRVFASLGYRKDLRSSVSLLPVSVINEEEK